MMVVLIVGCLIMSGCLTLRSEKKLDAASPGMTRTDVVNKVGHPAVVRGILTNDAGEKVEVWEYRVGTGKEFGQFVSEACFTAITCGAGAPVLLSSADTDRHWLYFVNDRFVAWGRAGDWERDVEKIRKMKFTPGVDIRQVVCS